MPTIIIEEEPGTQLPPPPGFVQPSIREQLKDQFPSEASFHVYEGQPYVVFGMWDYAENWSRYPVKSCHPYAPHWYGTEVTEAQFRQLVRALHAVGSV
jgi:hypothetical protein